jgi:hypothetical protein
MTKRLLIVFKNYSPNQVMLLPPSSPDELIAAGHPVRVMDG